MTKKSIKSIIFLAIIAALPAIGWVSVKEAEEPETEVSTSLTARDLFGQYVSGIYTDAGLAAAGLDPEVFAKAVTGYQNLKNTNLLSTVNNVLTIVDFNKSSRLKRLWIIDMDKRALLFNTLVAHGQGSGDDLPSHFSNLENSHQSSLGFYVTDDIYYGKHGRSLKLNGMDRGFNTNAKERAVVVHGAEYVSQSFINEHGRLGRSHGCPAVPVEMTDAIINAIKGHTCLFINKTEAAYTSDYLNLDNALTAFVPASSGNTLQASL